MREQGALEGKIFITGGAGSASDIGLGTDLCPRLSHWRQPGLPEHRHTLAELLRKYDTDRKIEA